MSSAFASFSYKSCKTEYKYLYSDFFSFFFPKAASTICSQKKNSEYEKSKEGNKEKVMKTLNQQSVKNLGAE